MRLRQASLSSSSAIGLEIGATAVRAVELSKSRRGLALQHFGHVDLPPGAVVGGEIQDPGAVVVALRRLWSEGGFGSRHVILSVSGQRVIVRQAEVAAMSAGDFASALEFQAADLIPIPIESAVLDFSILPASEGVQSAPGMMRVLLGAAHRDLITGHLGVLREASLKCVAIEAAPIAAIRASASASASAAAVLAEAPTTTAAVVDMSSDVTVIAVCEAGAVRYSRILGGGDSDFAAARAADRPVMEHASAAGFNGQGNPGGSGFGQPVNYEVDSVITKIEGSLSFFESQLAGGRLEQIFVSGSPSCDAAVIADLERRLSAPVVVLDAIGELDLTAAGLDEDNHRLASSTALLAVGAAEWAFEPSGNRVSLLPKEGQVAAALRRKVALAALAVTTAVIALGALTYHHSQLVGRARQEVVSSTAQNTAIKSQIRALAPVTSLHAAVLDRLGVLKAAETDDIAWSALLSEISVGMPPGTVLKTLSFTGPAGSTAISASTPVSSTGSAGAAGGPTVAGSGPTLGSVSVSVVANGDNDQVAVWLRALSKLPSLTAVWVPSGATTAGTVTFTSTASITLQAPMIVRNDATSPVKS